MIPGLVGFLVTCLVLLIVLYVAKLILDYMEAPPPIRTIVLLILGLIGLIFLLGSVLHLSGVYTVY